MSAEQHIPAELQRLLDLLLEGELDDANWQRLQDMLANDPAACEHYVELMRIQAELYGRFDTPVSTQPAPPEPVAAATSTARRSPLLRFLDTLPDGIQPAQHPVRFFSLAALLTSIFWGLAVLILSQRGDEPPAGQQHPKIAAANAFDARILRMQGVVWARASALLQPGVNLPVARTWELRSGLVQLLFGDGTLVVLEGPARFQIDAASALTLEQGKLLARAEGTAQGFTVHTPIARVTDLGTEFGVEVREASGEVEVQVFEGRVEVASTADADSPAQVVEAGKAKVFGNSPDRGFFAKELVMNRAVYLSLAAVLTLPVAHVANGAVISLDFNAQNVAAPFEISPTQSGDVGGAGTTFTGQAGNWNTLLVGEDTFDTGGATTIKTLTAPLATGTLAAGDGSATNVVFTLGVGATVGTPLSYHVFNGAGSGSTNLRQDMVVLFNPSVINWELSGLLPGKAYDIVLFGQRYDNITYNPAEFTIFGNGPNLFDSENDGNFLGVIANGSGKITGTMTYGSGGDSWSGLQISGQFVEPPPAPEPTSSAILGVGGLVLFGAARRRKARRTAA